MEVVKLTDAVIAALPVPAGGAKLFPFSSAVRGFAVRVTAEGVRAFVLAYRSNGKQRSYTIGRWRDPWTVAAAIREARALRMRIDRGDDPLAEKQAARAPAQSPPPVLTVAAVLDQFMSGYAQKRLRRPDNHRDAFDRLVVPVLGTMSIAELKRAHIKAALDTIADVNGPVMADRTLAYLRSALNQWAQEHEDFQLPNFKGLKWADEPAETRALSDHEIRLLWQATEREARPFSAAVRFMLWTAQRKGEVFGMTFDEVDWEARQWRIAGSRYKAKRIHTVELSTAAMQLLEQHRPDWGHREPGSLVFASDITGGKLGNGSATKRTLDRRIAALNGGVVLPAWKVHGLRSTTRSLMSRAGTRPDVAERVLGHLQGNRVERAYDQYDYAKLKREAMEALAAEIARIVGPVSPAMRELMMAEYVR